MKPSNARAVEAADIVFWTGPGMEAFLVKPLQALASDATIVELDDAEGLTKLPFREGGAFEAHDHGDDHAHHDENEHEADGDHDHEHDDHAAESGHHDHGGFDTHLWLDPGNAKAMAAAIGKSLAAADPENAEAYAANLAALNDRHAALTKERAAHVAHGDTKHLTALHNATHALE